MLSTVPLIMDAIVLLGLYGSNMTGFEDWTDAAVPCDRGGLYCTSCPSPHITPFLPLLHASELLKAFKGVVFFKHI